MVPDSIARCFVNVLNLISVLVGATSLIKVFLVVRVILLVVLRVSNMGPIVPCWDRARSGEVNSVVMHKYHD